MPKAKKGRVTVALHPICHQTIHANLSNAELARFGDHRVRLLENPAIATFLVWIADKPPDFYAPTR
ncbi:hypothetical protein [Qipengyuania marisflavi]|uniref:hypothetical protein n=1 Tax=Qipengyuania marisflavi TaxID=2486356 RepID=UPI0026B6FFBB